MSTRFRPLVHLLLVGCLCSTAPARAESAPVAIPGEEVLRRALEVRGGQEAFLKIRSFRAEGTVSFYTTRGPWFSAASVTNVWPLEVVAARPNSLRFTTKLKATPDASLVFLSSRYFEHGFDGRSAWSISPDSPPQILDGILGEERREEAECFGLSADAGNYRSVTNLGETDFEKRRCYELKLVRQSGNEETHYYDATTYFLIGIIRSSAFGPSLQQLSIEEYRPFGGFQFPTRIRYREQDGRYLAPVNAVEQINSIELNCVGESAFSMPREPVTLEVPKPLQYSPIAETDVKAMLQDWIDSDKLGEGLAVGWLDEHGPHVVCHGRCSPWRGEVPEQVAAAMASLCGLQPPKVSGETAFPLASISKVFTRLLLLDMVQRGEVRLDDPAQRYLPAAVHLPTHKGKQITLLHLATHTSGLPRYMGSSVEHVSEALSRYELTRDPGAEFEYSNTGIGLLGKALERKAGKSYQRLVVERICRPLGLEHTRVRRCSLPGIDGVESTADDLLKFASACLGLAPAPPTLSPLMRHINATHGGDIPRFALDLIVDSTRRRAVVALCSTANGRYGLARETLKHLIVGQGFKPASVADINYRACDDYVGQYLMDNNAVWSVRRNNNRLLVQEVGRESNEIFPTSQTAFSNGLTGMSVVFAGGASGQPVRLMLRDSTLNSNVSGRRICARPPCPGVTMELAPALADSCVGQYSSPEGQTVNIRRAEHRLTVETMADWNVQDVLPDTETLFTCPSDPALALTFLRDNDGQVTALVYHYAGSHTRYAKTSAAPPSITAREAERFVGVWESVVAPDAQLKRIVLKVSEERGSYRASVEFDGRRIKNRPFRSVTFLGKSSLSWYGSMGEDQMRLGVTVNDAGTEMSGIWKQGPRLSRVVLKRTALGSQAPK